MTKAFVLLSGGMDSTTCLHIAKSVYDEVEAISIDYGQKHKKETEYANKTCKSLGVNHSILNIQGILDGKGVMLTDAETAIPSISYDEITGVSPTYVPFRNGTLLSIITALAQKSVMQIIDDWAADLAKDNVEPDRDGMLARMRDSHAVYFGAHAEDAFNWAYPDCTPEFIGAMGNAIYTGTYYTVRLQAPLMALSKAQVVEWGDRLGVDWTSTWSCYAGGEFHCGECPTCRARSVAFRSTGQGDPTDYVVGSWCHRERTNLTF